MSDNRRKSTVREALSKTLQKQKRAIVGKLRGRYLFRAAVRLVIEYKEWIGEDLEEIGENVTANVKLSQRRKKSAEEEVTVRDRSFLLIPPNKRSKDEVAYLETLIKEIKAFKRYPEDIRELLAGECSYQYVPKNRTIIRQGHRARFLYYIIRGQVQVVKSVVDSVTEEEKDIDAGILGAGDMFGEISLLHRVPRTATAVSKSAKLSHYEKIYSSAGVDLLLVSRTLFDDELRTVLLEEWDVLRDALLNFNYFKGWPDETMRECCILSKILSFKPNEIVLGDGMGMVHYVYFLLSGECRLIEHMLVEKVYQGKKIQYKLYDSKEADINPRQRIGRSKKLDFYETSVSLSLQESESEMKADESVASINEHASSVADFIKMISSKKSTNITMERLSVITVTLQDVINQWHEITDAVEMLMRQPSTTDLNKYPAKVKTVFMQICLFYRGACFGLGEQMRNRRIVASTPTKCLLIPRYWLTQHNRANIWERVKNFMNLKYPNNKQLLNKYVENQAWAKYKKKYAKDIVKHGRSIPNDTKMYHVPYSVRINENIVDY